MSGSDFSVLMVCSGNICRSPIAEQLLRAKTVGHPVIVSSAGTIADEGAAMTEEAALMSRRFGGDPTGHRARPLTEEHLRTADLVLTATLAHRSSVVQLLPKMSRKTFTISEFARLAAALPEDELALLSGYVSLVDAVRALRGYVPPPNVPEDDDIADPYGRPIAIYQSVATRLAAEVAVIANALRQSGTHR